MVVDAGVGLDPRDIPDKYRVGVHICFPPSQRPCWCGGWHAPEDPADFVILAGPHASRWRFAQDRPGLAVLPSDQLPHPDLSTLHVPPGDLPLTTARIIEHVAEGLLVPGLIGYSFADMRDTIGRGRRLGFSHATSAAGILHTTDMMIAGASDWLSHATDLIFRQTGDGHILLADISECCERVYAECRCPPSAIYYATIDQGSPLCVAATLGKR